MQLLQAPRGHKFALITFAFVDFLRQSCHRSSYVGPIDLGSALLLSWGPGGIALPVCHWRLQGFLGIFPGGWTKKWTLMLILPPKSRNAKSIFGHKNLIVLCLFVSKEVLYEIFISQPCCLAFIFWANSWSQ